MIICKRCGSITINGICNNCSSSNFISHPLFGSEIRSNQSFFNTPQEIEKLLQWKTQLEDRTKIIPNVQSIPLKNEKQSQTIGKIAKFKIHKDYELMPVKKESLSEENETNNIEPSESLTTNYPHLKTRLNWHNQIKENTNVISDLKKFNLPTHDELENKLKKNQKKIRDSVIHKID